MRTVICHFYNEAYLLPWWLKHHRNLFDFGILIDHGSTDESVNICRKFAPNWRVVHSRLHEFNAYMTDFEVMEYERELPGWKIALNVTEFLMTALPLSTIENLLMSNERQGCGTSGFVIVDDQPGVEPDRNIALPLQRHYGIDDNAIISPEERQAIGLSKYPSRNRLYHCGEVGMYHPGRHSSFHPDHGLRVNELMIFHYGFAPWTELGIKRKLQIASKIPELDKKRKFGIEHLQGREQLEDQFQRLKINSIDLKTHEFANLALTSSVNN